MDIRLSKALLLAMVAGSLTACGGSGDSSSNGNATTDNNAKNISGEAVKGVLSGAVVTAKSINGETEFGITRTNTDGTYTLERLNLGTGPVLVELTTDSETQMTCDSATGCTRNGTTTKFGEKFPFDDPNFKLSAILPGIDATTSNARLMVTPVTHMAAQRVTVSGATTTEEIEGINRATAKLLGLDDVDITSIAPSDITSADSSTDDSAARKYGALVAAFSTLAEESDGDIAATVEKIADDFASDGAFKANTTIEGELGLADIFEAATESAQAAEEAGVDLGETGTDLALETTKAEVAPADSQVKPEEEDATPVKQLTESEAIEQGIALLEDLNTWYQALTNENVKLKGNMYEEHLNAAADLLPAFEETSEAIQAWNTLVVERETYCAYAFDGVCYEFETYTAPGPLFDSIILASILIEHAEFLETNHGDTPADDNEDGTFTISTNDFGDEIFDLAIFDILGTEEGELAEGAEIIATYSLDPKGKISEIDFYGSGADITLANEDEPVNITYAHENNVIEYKLDNLLAIARNGSDIDIESLDGDLSINLTFSNADKAEEYLDSRGTDNKIDPDSFASISIILNGGVVTNDQEAEINFIAKLNPETSTSQGNAKHAVDVSLSIDTAPDNNDDAKSKGVLRLIGTTEYEQTGTTEEGFDALFNNIAGTLSFTGNLAATLENEVETEEDESESESAPSTLTFTGSALISLDGANSDEKELGFESEKITLTGNLKLVNNTGAEPTTTSFSGEATTGYRAIKNSKGERLVIENNNVLSLESVVLKGDLSTESEKDGSAKLSITGILNVNDFDSFAVDLPELPEEGDIFKMQGSIREVDANTATLVFDPSIAEQFTNASGIAIEEQNVYAIYPVSVTREFISNDDSISEEPDVEEQGTEEPDGQGYYIVTIRFNDGYEYEEHFSEEDPAATGDIRDITKTLLDEYLSYYGAFIDITKSTDTVEIFAGTNGEPTTINDDYQFDLEVEIFDVYVDADELVRESETDDNYRKASIGLSIDAEATGLDKAEIRIIATRTSDNDFAGSAQLSYNNVDSNTIRSLSMDLDSGAKITDTNKNYLTIKNADSEMIITATCISDAEDSDVCEEDTLEFAGTVTVGDFTVGTLESRDGIPVFTFGNNEKRRILIPNFLVEDAGE